MPLPDRLYPYRGRIIRILPSDSPYGAGRTASGHRYVRILYDELPFSRRVSPQIGGGERAVFGVGTVTDAQFRFQTPRYLPGFDTGDELVLVFADGRLEAYNIITPAPFIQRPGIGGRLVGGYTAILTRIKAAQNADLDIYL